MTNYLTGIDIRKALLSANLNPNNYDEGMLFKACMEQGYTTAKEILDIAKHFLK